MMSNSKLKQYHDLLLKWQSRINLISPNTINDAWDRHFEDSLQIIDFIPEKCNVLMDIGSGAGFPALVVGVERPKLAVHLVESDQKKCAFLKAVSRETQANNVVVHNERIESMYGTDLIPDVISARALASLDKLLDYIYPWVEKNKDTKAIFMKGERADEEIEIARKSYNFDVQKHVSRTQNDACILVISDIARCE